MIKSIFRSPAVQAVLGALLAFYLDMVARTTRWTVKGEEHMRSRWQSDRGVVLAAWHSRIAVLPAINRKLARRWTPPTVQPGIIISQSRDGEFVARAAARIGLTTIRGSAANKKKRDKDKGGIEALRQANELLKSGGCVCLTPDGPRGPREHVSLGAIKIAQRAGAPIMVCGIAAAPAARLRTWDRLLLPGFFGKGCIVFSPPIEAPREADIEHLREQVEVQLLDVTAQAEKAVGLKPIPRPDPGAAADDAGAARDRLPTAAQ